MDTFNVVNAGWGAVIVPLAMGATQLVKQAEIVPSRYAGFLAVLIGVLLGLMGMLGPVSLDALPALVTGLVAGFTAAGVYSAVKSAATP